MSDWIESTSQGVLIRVLAQPKASRTEIVGPQAGASGEPTRLKIRIAAPPVEGAANEELLRFLKKKIHLPGVRLELLRGETAKTKDVLCLGSSIDILRERLTK